MNEEQKAFINDLLKSEGWRIVESHFRNQIDERRRIATQRPEGISNEQRGWYSAEASGMEEIIDGVRKLVE